MSSAQKCAPGFCAPDGLGTKNRPKIAHPAGLGPPRPFKKRPHAPKEAPCALMGPLKPQKDPKTLHGGAPLGLGPMGPMWALRGPYWVLCGPIYVRCGNAEGSLCLFSGFRPLSGFCLSCTWPTKGPVGQTGALAGCYFYCFLLSLICFPCGSSSAPPRAHPPWSSSLSPPLHQILLFTSKNAFSYSFHTSACMHPTSVFLLVLLCLTLALIIAIRGFWPKLTGKFGHANSPFFARPLGLGLGFGFRVPPWARRRFSVSSLGRPTCRVRVRV